MQTAQTIYIKIYVLTKNKQSDTEAVFSWIFIYCFSRVCPRDKTHILLELGDHILLLIN